MVLGFGLVPGASGGTILILASAQGWMSASAGNGFTADNDYVAGNCGAGDCYTGEFRNFFEFAIPNLDGPVLSAILMVDTRYEALRQSPSITYQVTSLDSSFGFSDLGTGTLYGSRTYNSFDQYRTDGIVLDAAAVDEIRQSQGGSFALGGRVTSFTAFGAGLPDQLIFGRSGGAQELLIVTGSAAPMLLSAAADPEPASAALLGSGALLLVLACFRRRRDR
jgi:hypothetical protein